MFELNNEQLNIIKSTEKRVVVNATVGSGKSETVVERIRYLLDNGEDPSGIVCISFTNNAAENIRERLGPRGQKCHISTVHSYANYLLLSRGYETAQYIEEENFDELFLQIRKYPNTLRKVEHLIVDELQDTSNVQGLFYRMINPTYFMGIGDSNQMIYDYEPGIDGSYLRGLERDSNFKSYDLVKNYRNGENILSFANNFIKGIDEHLFRGSVVIPMNPNPGVVTELYGDINGLVGHIKQAGDLRDWFILVRTNREVEKYSMLLRRLGVPNTTFKQADYSNADLRTKLNEDKVKVITCHSSKGLESKNVAVAHFGTKGPSEKRLAYVAATRAKERLVWCHFKKKK